MNTENKNMKKIVVSTPFKQAIIKSAQAMVLENKNEDTFVDEHKKKFDGVVIFIDKKPNSVLFTFDFPKDFIEGTGKKIYVGNNWLNPCYVRGFFMFSLI